MKHIFTLLFLFSTLAFAQSNSLEGEWDVYIVYNGRISHLVDTLNFDQSNSLNQEIGETTIICQTQEGGVTSRNNEEIIASYTINCSNNSFHSDWKLFLIAENEDLNIDKYKMYTSRNMKSEYIITRSR